MKLVGLDLNASDVCAVGGAGADCPSALLLDPPHADLPLVLNLENSTIAIGRSGARLQRQQPHVVCHDFLAEVGESGPASKRWKHNRHRLDAGQALTAVWKHLHLKCLAKAAVVSLPAYLAPHQIEALVSLAHKARFPVCATLPAPLAAAMAAHAEHSWFGYGLVIDADAHALTISTIRVAEGRAEFVEAQVLRHLSVSVWKERLLNALADACVLQSRRDPRASPQAEQTLFDQLDVIIDAGSTRSVQVGIEARQWYQNLVIEPEHPVHICEPLVQQLMERLQNVWDAPWPEAPPGIILLTCGAARLPGVADAVRRFFAEHSLKFPRPAFPSEPTASEDFGEDLLRESRSEGAGVVVLSPDVLARAGQSMVADFQHAGSQHVHLEEIALPSAQSVGTGPARIQFHGQDYYVNGALFRIGRHPDCDLSLMHDINVADRHCEIIHERRCYMIVDSSERGTLVNGVSIAGKAILRAGDWIRLGPEGPLLRFLGRDRTQSTIVRA